MLQQEYKQNMMDDLIASTGLGRDVLTYHLDLSAFIDEFFSKAREMRFENIHLFGGTAINRAFFGKSQRFSLDLDLNYDGRSIETGTNDIRKLLAEIDYKIKTQEWMNSKHTLRRLIVEPKSGRIVDFNVDFHRIEERPHAPYKELVLHSITEFFGYPQMKTSAPSYELEYLLAGKLFALKDRTLDRDIYDTYMGLKLEPNYKLVRKHVEEYDSYPQLVGIVINKLEKLSAANKKLEINRYIPEYCITDFNLIASEINRLLLNSV